VILLIFKWSRAIACHRFFFYSQERVSLEEELDMI